MNKLVVGGLVALLIVIGVGAFFMVSRPANEPTATPTTLGQVSPVSPASPVAAEAHSIKELLTSGSAQECSFQGAADSSLGKGVVYVSSGKMRGDFEVVTQGQPVKSHIIVDGDTLYSWLDGTSQGFKVTLDTEAAADSAEVKAQGEIDLDQKLDYSCRPWVASAAVFALPAGIEFADMSALIPSAQPGAAGSAGTAAQCAACDNVPAESRAQCLTALGCN